MNVISYAINWTHLRRLHRPIVIDPPGKESYSVRSKNAMLPLRDKFHPVARLERPRSYLITT